MLLACFALANNALWAVINIPSRTEVFFEYLKKTASETLTFDKETTDAWLNKLKNLQIKENLQLSFDRFREMLNDPETQKNDQRIKQNRQFLEQLGRQAISNDGLTLNDYAREVIDRFCPNLRNTGYYHDPAKALSYILMLDPSGFVENIKIIKGPLETPMTLKEAYQYYTRTDPKKADTILKMLESLQKLNNPDTNKEQLKIIIRSVEQTIELLNGEP